MAVSGQQLPNTTFKGYCRDSHHTKSNVEFVDVRDVHYCQLECKKSISCIAFAYTSILSGGFFNYRLYSKGPKGPYVTGTNDTNVICYVFPGNY